MHSLHSIMLVGSLLWILVAPVARVAAQTAIATESESSVPEDTNSPSSPTSQAAIQYARVAIYDHSDGSAKSPKALRKILTEDAGFKCLKVTPRDIRDGKLADCDVLIIPGGSGSLQSKKLEQSGRDQIRSFVQNGGGYVGICAGSYLATSDYTWSLHLLNAKVFDRAHWARGTGEVRLKVTDVGQSLLQEDDPEIACYYGQGPLLIPDTKSELPAYEPLAEYATEIAEKGAPRGVMIGTTAIARSHFGKGRVICYSPHPEQSGGPNHLILHGVRWAAGESGQKQ